MSDTSWWVQATTCYHEPKVHDHELYFLLVNINLFVLLPLAILGVFFNASALICLYSKPKITSGVFIYLKALLILDHCHILISLATFLLPQFCDSHHSTEHTFYKFCMFERRFLKYTLPRIESTINLLHVWTIASLSAHRYWKISRPVLSRFKDTTSRARYVLWLMLVALIIYRLPIFLIELQLKWRPVFRINRRPDTTELLSPYRIAYHSFFDPILSNILPFIWMCVFSLLTLCEIIKSRHFTYAQFSIDSNGSSSTRRSSYSNESLKTFRRRPYGIRQKQEFRATISIILIILLYLLFHSLQLYNVFRKWQLLIQKKCPTRTDYIQSHINKILSMLSSSVNAFVFIAFTNRLRLYLQMLIRKTTSKSLSYNSSEAPLSPKTIIVASTDPMLTDLYSSCQHS